MSKSNEQFAFNKTEDLSLIQIYVKINQDSNEDSTVHEKAMEVFNKMDTGEAYYFHNSGSSQFIKL